MDFSFYFNYFSKDSIGRYDLAPIYSEPEVFSLLIEDILFLHKNTIYNKIIAIDSVGFILGTAIAIKTNKGLILARKEGKIPLKKETLVSRSFVDYTGNKKSLEINKCLINQDDSILIVDDWVETGSQVKSIIEMVEELNAKVVGIASIGSDRNEKTKILFEKYNLKSIGTNF